MTIKNLYPTSRPSLDLNFANTKRLDPRITFSRASSGTYFDGDGLLKSAATNTARFDHNPATGESLGLLVEEARTNSQTYSNNFATNWTTTQAVCVPNSGLAPDGTFTATLLYPSSSGSASNVGKEIGSVSSTAATNTIYAKASGKSWLRLYGPQGNTAAWFNLTTGTVGTVQAGITASIASVGNGWYRCTATQTVTFYTLYAAVTDADNSGTITASGTNGILVWGAQLEAGAFPTSYIPTPATFTGRTSTATYYDSAGVIQTALSGVARSNAFFPDSSGVMRSAGLLLEGAGTNLATYSEQLDNAAWTKTFATVTANAVAAPDNLTTADKLVEGTGAYAIVSPTATISSSATYTTSIFVKSAERTACYIRAAFGGGNNWVTAKYDLVNGLTEVFSGSSSSFTGPASSIQKFPNGWWRISCTYTGNGGSPTFGLMDSYGGVIEASSGARLYTGNGASGIHFWGAQLEASPYPTSYIPTVASTVTRSADTSTSATVTRSADVASITGTNFSSWYNADQSTCFIETQQVDDTGGSGAWYFGPNSSPRWWSYSYGYTQAFDGVSGSGVVNTSYAGSRALMKYAVSINSTNQTHVGVINGLSPVTGTWDSIAGTITQLDLGYRRDNLEYLNGRISRFTYYPVSFAGSTLQALTI